MAAVQSLLLSSALRGIFSRYFVQPGFVANHSLTHDEPIGYLYKLPNEIIHYIFEIAAQLSPQCCLALCGVSSWAREWALRYVLPAMVLITDRDVDWFIASPRPRNPSLSREKLRSSWKGLTHHTRSIWLDEITMTECLGKRNTEQDVLSILAICPNLTNIAGNGECFQSLLKYWKDGKGGRHPTIQWTMSGGLFEPDYRPFTAENPFKHEEIPHVTHLTLLSIRDEYTSLDLSPYSNLTHVAFYYHFSSLKDLTVLLRPIQAIKTIQMIVVTSSWCTALRYHGTVIPMSLADAVNALRVSDERLYILECCYEGETFEEKLGVEEWKREAYTPYTSIWQSAVEFSRNMGYN